MSFSNEKPKRFPQVEIDFIGSQDDNESEGVRKLDFDAISDHQDMDFDGIGSGLFGGLNNTPSEK